MSPRAEDTEPVDPFGGLPPDRLARLRTREKDMVEGLRDLVECESPSDQPDAIDACFERLSGLARDLVGAAPEEIEVQGRRHLLWRFGSSPRVLLLGHIDTVWPLGTIDRWPFTVAADRATGPGVFDMKAGLIQLFFALESLDRLDGVEVLVTGDEEAGSPTSKDLIEREARGVEAALILEPSLGGALKTSRKGISNYEIVVRGRAAHAGLDPDSGVNAGLEMAHQLLRLAGIADDGDTTVTPTRMSAGTTTNTVPALASCAVDVRAATIEEQKRVDYEMRGLSPALDGSSIEVLGGPNRPPLPETSSAELFKQARAVAHKLGLPELAGVRAGGGSDGNLTAGVGTPTLDGLGAVGGGAHAEGEHVSIPHIAERAALVAGIVGSIMDGSSLRASASRTRG